MSLVGQAAGANSASSRSLLQQQAPAGRSGLWADYMDGEPGAAPAPQFPTNNMMMGGWGAPGFGNGMYPGSAFGGMPAAGAAFPAAGGSPQQPSTKGAFTGPAMGSAASPYPAATASGLQSSIVNTNPSQATAAGQQMMQQAQANQMAAMSQMMQRQQQQQQTMFQQQQQQQMMLQQQQQQRMMAQQRAAMGPGSMNVVTLPPATAVPVASVGASPSMSPTTLIAPAAAAAPAVQQQQQQPRRYTAPALSTPLQQAATQQLVQPTAAVDAPATLVPARTTLARTAGQPTLSSVTPMPVLVADEQPTSGPTASRPAAAPTTTTTAQQQQDPAAVLNQALTQRAVLTDAAGAPLNAAPAGATWRRPSAGGGN